MIFNTFVFQLNKKNMEIIGSLKLKGETNKVSEKFQKRDFVVTTDKNTPYPQHVSFQITQDKCSILDRYNEGDEIKVHFNLRGREWNGPQGVKYFNTLEAWRIENISGGGNSNNNYNQSNAAASSSTTFNTDTATDADDLPF